MQLEVNEGERGTLDWRLSVFSRRHGPWSSADFRPARVRWVYWMCGDGHIFLDHLRLHGGPDPKWTVDDFNIIAAVGGVAAGKSYLLLRTLHQHLGLSGIEHVTRTRDIVPVEDRDSDWLEEEPLRLLENHYQRMAEDGLPMEPTTRIDMLPYRFLTEHLSSDIVDKISAIHHELAGDDNVDPSWGQRFRQPIVKRYQIGSRRILTAVADLAGELFDRHNINDDHRQRVLRNYGTLAWVIDPVITAAIDDFLPEHLARSVVPASMRPDPAVNANPDQIRGRRRSVQQQLARSLAQADSRLAADIGPTQHLLVCITKADLIHLALRDGQKLANLGEPDDVVEGVARYLLEVANRASSDQPSLAVDRTAERSIINPIYRMRHEPTLYTAVVRQFATAFADHYSAPDAFWGLVHRGTGDTIEIPAGKPSGALPPGRLTVPSLNEHIAGSLSSAEPAGKLRTRDLVMSALGCGLAYGLGFRQPIEKMLQQSWRDLRFFPCSPLASAPIQTTDGSERITLLEKTARFPQLHDRSAALTQLLLNMLRGVRDHG